MKRLGRTCSLRGDGGWLMADGFRLRILERGRRIAIMERDMELVRELLFRLERNDHSLPDGFAPEMIGYHRYLLVNAGLAEGHITPFGAMATGKPSYRADVYCLTWNGHEFLQMTRDKNVWAWLKKNVFERGLPYTLPILLKIAEQQAHIQWPGVIP